VLSPRKQPRAADEWLLKAQHNIAGSMMRMLFLFAAPAHANTAPDLDSGDMVYLYADTESLSCA
jgi:hypothetical protein